MTKLRLYGLLAAVTLVVSLLITGCATVDTRVNILYEPVVRASGGSGELYLVQKAAPAVAGESPAVQWILGEVTNKDGEQIGRIVTDLAPNELVANAFSGEFKAAGFAVMPVKALPDNVAKGVSVSSVTITLDEVSSLFKVDAKSTAKISVELWKNGSKLTKLDYEVVYSDSAITGRDQILSDTLKKNLQTLMNRAVPEIIRMLEQK